MQETEEAESVAEVQRAVPDGRFKNHPLRSAGLMAHCRFINSDCKTCELRVGNAGQCNAQGWAYDYSIKGSPLQLRLYLYFAESVTRLPVHQAQMTLFTTNQHIATTAAEV